MPNDDEQGDFEPAPRDEINPEVRKQFDALVSKNNERYRVKFQGTQNSPVIKNLNSTSLEELQQFLIDHDDSFGARVGFIFKGIFKFIWRVIKFVLWFVFIMPGGLITWQQYYFPRRGQVYATGRRLDNTIVKIIYSTSVWIPIFVVIGLIYWVSKDKMLVATFWASFKPRN